MYMRERSLQEEKFPRRKRNPSFSSSLLDSIYRSIDESNGGEGDLGYVRESKKQSNSGSKRAETKGGSSERTNLRRAIMIENWVEKQSVHSSMFTNSASSSSDSSSGAAFSSSDQTESSYKRRSKQSSVVVSVRSEDLDKPKSESGGGGGGGGGFNYLKLGSHVPSLMKFARR